METDVVVIGSGAGGLCAAIVAHDQGLETLVVEKTAYVGGTTAISGGAVWIPVNSLMRQVQQTDSEEAVDEYLHATAGQFADTPVMKGYRKHGPAMVDYLQSKTEVKLAPRAYFPDYYPEVKGSSMGGRTLDPVDFDARSLGEDFGLLRGPRPEFTLFGGMMVNRADIVNLFKARRSLSSMKYVARLLWRHLGDRLRYPRGTRLVFGNALAARLFKSALDRKIPVWRSSRATTLTLRDGRVTGVVVEQDGKTIEVVARRGVVLASGGFPANGEMRAKFFPHAAHHHTVAPKGNTGDGAQLAASAGGRMGSEVADEAFWTPVSLLKLPNGSTDTFPHLVTDRAKPGAIAVDASGRRFTDESCNYHDFVKEMHVAGAVPCFLICDARFVDRYGFGFIRPWPLPRRHLLKAGYVERARTLLELARRLGIAPDALVATVERYNTFARKGEDPDFGKGSNIYSRLLGDPEVTPNPCIAPIESGPFYGLRIYPGSIGTARGIVTDGDARVLDGQGRPIQGLYACGNDMHSVMGGNYPGPGITLGPALTFGYAAAMHLARSDTPVASQPGMATAALAAHQ